MREGGRLFMGEQKIQVTNAVQQSTSSADCEDEKDIQAEEANREGKTQKDPVIWTPGFIVFFALVFALGLSVASIITQGWLNGLYRGEVVLLGYNVLIAGLWIALFLRTKSFWLRLAAIFGFLWIFFTGSNLLISLFQLPYSESILPHSNAAAAMALLGAFLCLSFKTASTDSWDRWFLWIALLVFVGGLLAAYLSGVRDLSGLENILTGVALFLCIAVWWLRLSCWHWQPLPAFLFGSVPLIQLLFILPHRSETNFFYTQVMLLALILGILRVIQKERHLTSLTN